MSIVLNAPREASRGFLEFSRLAIYNTVPILWTLYALISPDRHHFVLGSENQPCFACLPRIEPQPGQSLKAVSWDTRRIHCFVSCLLDIPAREGNGTPLQYSCLENPMDGGAWKELLRIGHDWASSLSLFSFMHWKRKWQPTPVFLPGESQGWGAWWAAVYGVAQSQTWLRRLRSSSSSSSRHSCSPAWHSISLETVGFFLSSGFLEYFRLVK